MRDIPSEDDESKFLPRTFTLRPESIEIVDELQAKGVYRTKSDVVDAALALLKESRGK